MSEQGTTKDQSRQANEQICEKLLHWHRCLPGSKGARCGYTWQEERDTPEFLSAEEAQLIIDALVARRLCVNLEYMPWSLTWDARILTTEQLLAGGYGKSWQEAIRAAMCRYLDLIEFPWPSEPGSMRDLRVKYLEQAQ